ncbi:hypothetical protein [Pseudomonas sp. PLMAX]|uniref:hypothetical protein n=1 Tax=Pseudomonas sp. PLMAX TaxID=2201998 RepID=UPI0038B97455
MRLKQLHDYLGKLLAAGVDPNKIVCIHGRTEGTGVEELSEVSSARLVTGPFLGDPLPKMPAYLAGNEQVLLLRTFTLNYDKHFGATGVDVERLPTRDPEKSWPYGYGVTCPDPSCQDNPHPCVTPNGCPPPKARPGLQHDEIDLKAALKPAFEAGQGVIQIGKKMSDEDVGLFVRMGLQLSKGHLVQVVSAEVPSLPFLEALTTDAERYRWLRNPDFYQPDDILGPDGTIIVGCMGHDEALSLEELDKAIDVKRLGNAG